MTTIAEESPAKVNGHAPALPESVAAVVPPAKPSRAGAVRKARTEQKQKSVWQVVWLSVDQIAPCPYQPRLLFDAAEMKELVESVKSHGVQQPILVRPAKQDGTAKGHANGGKIATLPYELVAGERRLRASKQAGRKHIPAIVRELDDRTAAEIALTENVQRSNLSIIEEARGYRQLMLKFRMTEERIAKKVGKSVATIQATMKLLALPEQVQELMAHRKLSASHGHALLALAPHERVCVLVAQHVAANSLTAVSLSTTLLPNAREMKSKGLLQELDFRTKFDWQRECASCPHKAYVRDGYASYCLKPSEWHKKQEAAIAQQKDEATQAMQAAREAVEGKADVTQLPPGSYRDLSHMHVPSGCTGHCPCRKEVPDPADPTKTLQVCLDPKRLNELKDAERKAHEDARRHRYRALWGQAKDALSEEQKDGASRKVAALVCLPLVTGSYLRYGDPENWQTLARQVGLETGFVPDWNQLFDSQSQPEQVLQVLQEAEPGTLLLFAASLLLAQEATEAVRFASDTPNLDFVLERTQAMQPELEEGEEDGVEAENRNTLQNGGVHDEPKKDSSVDGSFDADEHLEDEPLGDEPRGDEHLSHE